MINRYAAASCRTFRLHLKWHEVTLPLFPATTKWLAIPSWRIRAPKFEGVVSPRFNPGKAHLLMVAYDTDKTSTSVLLEQSRASGYTAQLIGM